MVSLSSLFLQETMCSFFLPEAIIRRPVNCTTESHRPQMKCTLMALAEIIVKYLDGDPGSLDYDEEWAAEDNKFRSITSFTASRASLRELRDYLADTLKYARIRAERQIKAGELPGGWFDPKDWDGWQKHMEGLIHRLDGVLALEGSTLELAHPLAPTVPELTM